MRLRAKFAENAITILLASSLGFLVAIALTDLSRRPFFAALASITALILLGKNWHQKRRDRDASTEIHAGTASSDLDPSAGGQGASSGTVSALPTREALLARINAEGRGVLGAIAFVDFERLTAFDPVMADRAFTVLMARLRRMVPPTRFVAQIDRSHIGIWFGDATGHADARAELNAIGYALGDAITAEGREIVPQIHLRIATFDGGEGQKAATFLYRLLASFALPSNARATGVNTPEVADLARDRYDLEQDLRQAIARGELALEFQPLVDASLRRVCGAEALLRWHHAQRGLVSPARFIPVMEAIGLASEIGAWVLNAAAREANRWRSTGFGHLRMSVNVSGLQLERDDLPILVERTLRLHDIEARALEIELTESVATSDADHRRQIFHQLREMGVALAVDDFGTGYSGFSSLRALAFDKIKIDREFITSVDTRRDSQAICKSIIALAEGLGIQVLAEGVERQAEFHWLYENGCHLFQGYYFSRPLKAPQFLAFARDRHGLEELLAMPRESEEFSKVLRA